jgi:glycosyltransferase involved in cell wall biosynthesis
MPPSTPDSLAQSAVPLTALVPTHGRPSLLERTLRTVAACTRPEGYAGCVVVENGSQAGAEAVVARLAEAFPAAGFRYLHHARANKSAALNAALDAVPDDHLVVLFDDDVRVDPGTLVAYAEAASEAVTEASERAYFGGPSAPDYERVPPEWVRPLLPPSARGTPVQPDGSVGVLGYNWAVWAHDVKALGGFDPNFGPGSPTGARGQETDMMRRMNAAGITVRAVPGAMVWHYVPASRSSFGWLVRRMYRDGIGRGRFERERAPLVAVVGAAAARAARCAMAAPVKLIRGQRLEACRAAVGLSEAAGKVVGASTAPRR